MYLKQAENKFPLIQYKVFPQRLLNINPFKILVKQPLLKIHIGVVDPKVYVALFPHNIDCHCSKHLLLPTTL